MIKNVLSGHEPSDESWTCKEIVIYARRHGYVPFPKIKIVQDGSEKKYITISANDSMYSRLSMKHKALPRNNAVNDTSLVINCKPGCVGKLKKSKMGLDKNKGDTSADIKNIVVTNTIKKETSSVNKHSTPSFGLKINSVLDFMANDATKIGKSKKKRSERQINKDSVLHKLRRVCMKPTLCEPKRIVEFISANDDDVDGWNDDLNEVDILSLYSTVDLGDSSNADILEVDKDRAELCHFVRKSFKWLSLWNGPKPNHYTVPEILVAVAAELFVEDICRRALNVSWNHYDPKGETPITIVMKDALMALRRRKQFDIFSNCGLGVACDIKQVNK